MVGSRSETLMNRCLARACQIDVRSAWYSRDLGERSTNCLTCVRLPPRDLSVESLLTLFDEGSDRLRVRDREDELHLTPAEGFDLGDSAWHPRLGNLGLTNPTKAFAEQCLDGLDPGTVIGYRNLLPEALPALGAGACGPRLPARARGSLVEDAADRLNFLAAVSASAGRTADRRSEACDLSSSGSVSAITGTRWCLAWARRQSRVRAIVRRSWSAIGGTRASTSHAGS